MGRSADRSSPPQPPRARVRPAREADIRAVNRIYDGYVDSSAITFDTACMSEDDRRAWLRRHGEGRHRAFVAESKGRLVGFASSGELRSRPAYEPSVETTVYIAATHLGRGVGTALYGALFEALASEDVHRAYAAISLPNPSSEALHERFGFVHVGTFSEVGRKLGRYWDVAWFEKRLH